MLFRSGGDSPTLTPFTSHMCAGIDTDARVVPKLFWRAEMALDELHTLAVVTVMHACQENPTLVGGGVDVVTIDQTHHVQEFYYNEQKAEKIRQKFIDRVWKGLTL